MWRFTCPHYLRYLTAVFLLWFRFQTFPVITWSVSALAWKRFFRYVWSPGESQRAGAGDGAARTGAARGPGLHQGTDCWTTEQWRIPAQGRQRILLFNVTALTTRHAFLSTCLSKQQMLSERQKITGRTTNTFGQKWNCTVYVHGFFQSAVFPSAASSTWVHFAPDFKKQKPDLLIVFPVILSVAVQRPSTGKVLSLWGSGQQEKWHWRGQVGLLFEVWIKISVPVLWLMAVVCVYPHTFSTLSSGTATN